MSDKPDVTNSLAGLSGAGAKPGDVPDAMRRRYLTERRFDGSVEFFADATVLVPSFRDNGRRLTAARSDPATIRDLLAVAQHRGWTIVEVRGAPGFRREVWTAAQAVGLEVQGYRPNERDRQAAERRQARSGRPEPLGRDSSASPALDLKRARDRLRVVDAVVRQRIVEPAEQVRVLAAARARAAELQRLRDRDRGFRLRDR